MSCFDLPFVTFECLPRKSYDHFVLLDNELATTCQLQRMPLPEKGMFGFRQMFNIGNFNERLATKSRDLRD